MLLLAATPPSPPAQAAFPHPSSEEQRRCVELLGAMNAGKQAGARLDGLGSGHAMRRRLLRIGAALRCESSERGSPP